MMYLRLTLMEKDMTKLLALLMSTAFAGAVVASEPATTGPATPPAPSADMMHKDKQPMGAPTGTDMGAMGGTAKPADDHNKDGKHHDHSHHHHHHKHGHKHQHDHKHGHHHHHKQDQMPGTPAHPDMMKKDNAMPAMPNSGDKKMSGNTGAWDSQNKTAEAVKPTTYTTHTTKSWGEDWWSKEYRDQGKSGIASATPGSPNGEMSK